MSRWIERRGLIDSQKQTVPKLSPTHPMAKDVQLLLYPVGGRLIDIVNPSRDWVPTGDAKLIGTNRGRAASFDGSGDYYAHTGYPEITGSTGTFFIWMPTVRTGGANGHILFGSTTGPQYLQITGAGVVYNFSSGSTGNLSNYFSSTNTSLVFSSGGTAATLKLFQNGADSGLTWAGAPGAWATGNKVFNFGRYGAGWDVNGDVIIAGYSKRTWTVADAAAFHANPLLIFEEESRSIYLPSAGGGSTGTLATTNANDTSTASGTTSVIGALAKTNGNDTSAASGTTTVTGTLARTNADDTSSASGSVGSNITGTVSYTNGNDTSSASGTTTVIGVLAKSNVNDTSAASGTTTVIGAVAYTNINDSVSASGYAAPVTGTVAYTNSNDTATADGITTSKAGGDDAFHHVGWSKKAWQKKQQREELIAETIAQTYRKLIGEEPEPEVVKTLKAEIPKSPIVENKKSLDYTQEAQFINWLSQQVEAIKQQRYLAELDDEETLLLLL